jgi:hypothetical protein
LIIAGCSKSNQQCYKIVNRENKILKQQDYKLEDGELT